MREILVQFREDVEAEARLRVIEEAGGRLREEIAPQRVAVVVCPEGVSVSELMERFRRSPVVAHVEPNGRVELLDSAQSSVQSSVPGRRPGTGKGTGKGGFR